MPLKQMSMGSQVPLGKVKDRLSPVSLVNGVLKRNASVKPVSYVGRLTEALPNYETSQKISNDYRFKNRLPKTGKCQGDMMEEQEEQPYAPKLKPELQVLGGLLEVLGAFATGPFEKPTQRFVVSRQRRVGCPSAFTPKIAVLTPTPDARARLEDDPS